MTRTGPFIDLTHGAGGRATNRLIQDVFVPALGNVWLAQGDDGAVMDGLSAGDRLVMTTDAHVVSPLFFPGGDIGSLAVCGTVNDLAMMGARPLYLSVGFILEEGLPLETLGRIVTSMAATCRDAGVSIVTADTKVVERGKGDGLFITTAGVGALPGGRTPSGRNARPGDAILVSGSLGEHGLTILNVRENLSFETDLASDAAPLNGLVDAIFAAVSPGDIHTLRDPTRGGLAATLNEIAHQSGVGMTLEESRLPLQPSVVATCELLGLDPLHLANEGKAVVICDPACAPAVLDAMQDHPLGRKAAMIGRVTCDPDRFVQIETSVGGVRMLDWMNGDPLPRIC